MRSKAIILAIFTTPIMRILYLGGIIMFGMIVVAMAFAATIVNLM